jgi:uncharacterized protein YjfI (DUF2170 family)
MRYQEFKPLKPFKAQVRLAKEQLVVQTIIWAEAQAIARRHLNELYGKNNVFTVSPIHLSEAKQLNPQDQQITALKQQAKQLKHQAKLTRARKQVQTAQDQLKKAKLPTQAKTQP